MKGGFCGLAAAPQKGSVFLVGIKKRKKNLEGFSYEGRSKSFLRAPRLGGDF